MGLDRRRFLRISGAAAALGLNPSLSATAAGGLLVSWSGVALGAAASMQLLHPDAAAARRLIARVVSEVRRLEGIFSLYRQDSALSELNRRGVLIAPPADLVTVLAECGRYVELTSGAFDPTVQPLWTTYSERFSDRAVAALPPTERVAEALSKVGWRHLRFDPDVVVFGLRGMALTLNGIAQGYITDRIVALLRDAGIAHALVDMGEIRAIGGRPDGEPWRVALDLPRKQSAEPRVIAVSDRAVATSSARGFTFGANGACNHLFDPLTGRCADPARAVSVLAPNATQADALSTAFELMPPERIADVLARLVGTVAYLPNDGGVTP